jgi:FHA domain
MQLRVQLTQPDVQSKTLVAAGPSIRCGREVTCEIAVDPSACTMVSGTHARIEVVPGGFALVHVSQSNNTLLNDAFVAGSVPVKAGDRVRLGVTGPTITILEIGATPGDPSSAVRFDATMKVDARHMALLRGTVRTQRFEIAKGGVIGRNARSAQFHLDHPHVSGLHASLAVIGPQVILADFVVPTARS